MLDRCHFFEGIVAAGKKRLDESWRVVLDTMVEVERIARHKTVHCSLADSEQWT